MEIAAALAALALLAAANIVATRVALRDPYSERHQKVFQLLAVWLVPVFGAIFILALHRKPEKPTGQYGESADPPLNDFSSSRYVGRSVNTHADDQP